ncbi:MAG: hypothetical protein HN759_11630 [Akkermansiaceae bacterium]|nr:hypothetical protein [Akkermansiaceae bacterium]
MNTRTITPVKPIRSAFITTYLALLLNCISAFPAHAQTFSIPETEITTLQKEIATIHTETSAVKKRRTCKTIIRKGNSLVEANPTAPNRYIVLAIVFQTKKRLLTLDNNERNRTSLYETCAKLTNAPDEFANVRLRADLLLSDRDMALKNADMKQRAEALSSIVDRYRGTSAEAKSLMMAALIAKKLEAEELERTIYKRMDLRFSGDHEVIEFRRAHLGFSKLDVVFAGDYTRADGVVLRFPIDLIGRLSVMVFWSQKAPNVELYLKQIKALQDQLPGRFEVFSFNLDELPNAGAGTLRNLQLDWTVMRLPGGKKSQAFRTYGRNDPIGVLVNAYGHTILVPSSMNAAQQAKLGVRGVALQMPTLTRRLDDARYLSQLQSLLVGDVLVTEPDGHLDAAMPPELKMLSTGTGKDARAKLARTAKSAPAEILRAIQGCFLPAPFRYRLTTAEALANYDKAEKLCGEAISKHPAAPDLWIVRNRRIIALLGMWNLAGEPKYLEQAAQEARASLTAKLPPGADVVPRFCLAKELLRKGDSNPESVIQDLIEKTGGAKAPSSAHAAATILALYANAQDLHDHYSATLLAAPDGGNPMLWSMVALLRERIYTYRLLRANHIHKERNSVRTYMINHGAPPITRQLPPVTLKTLDGKTLSLPQDTKGKLTLLVFVEPSAEPDAEFPIAAGGEVKVSSHNMLQYACDLADRHINKDVTPVVAFLSEDTERIDAFMKKRKLTCQAAIVPGGLTNPMVRQLGVVSADRIPNVFLIRRDGAIVWHASGLPYGDAEKFVALLAMKVHIEACEVETAYQALKKGDFKQAARVFGGPYLPMNPDRFGWRAPRYHGQALAYIGLKDWDAALESIEKAIDAQRLRYFQGKRRSKDPTVWRKEAATVTTNNPDDTMVELWNTKAEILDKLGRKDEASQMRKRTRKPGRADAPSVYKAFHEKLIKLKTRNQIDKP